MTVNHIDSNNLPWENIDIVSQWPEDSGNSLKWYLSADQPDQTKEIREKTSIENYGSSGIAFLQVRKVSRHKKVGIPYPQFLNPFEIIDKNFHENGPKHAPTLDWDAALELTILPNYRL